MATPTKSSVQKIHLIAENAMLAFSLLLRRRSDISAEAFYGFKPTDVVNLHFDKNGTGEGVWFRLRDGRVFDQKGEPSEKESEWYSATLH